VAEATVRKLLIRADLWCAPTAIVGCGPTARRLATTLQNQPELGFRPVGFISDGSKDQRAARDLPLPLLGTLQDGISSDTPIEAALIVLDGGLAEHAVRSSALPFPYIVSVQGSETIQNLWLHARPLGTAVGVEIRRELLIPGNLLLKRILDLAVALPLAILALPVVILSGLAILLVDPGPIIYAQTRVGRNGRPVQVLKLRTMFSDAEARLQRVLQNDPAAAAEWERHLKLSNDPRVLPIIGRFIRRASFDELPQLWNIVRGDMSLVGPRPFPPYHVQRFDQAFQALRASVVPGLTGFWQISSRSDGDLDRQKAEDSFYITNWSVWLDLFILVRTIPAVVQGKGAR
jgi:Undecaprenyl-phosphate galactose phosphotransferase WbaP